MGKQVARLMLKEIVGRHRLESSGSELGRVAECCAHGNERTVSVKFPENTLLTGELSACRDGLCSVILSCNAGVVFAVSPAECGVTLHCMTSLVYLTGP